MHIETVRQIQETQYKFFAAITGGGQSFVGDFCQIEGASKNLVGAIIPYNQVIFDNFIGGRKPDNYVSSESARKLAVSSFNQCLKAGVNRKLSIGIGASSSLAKQNERQDRKHKIFISVHGYYFTSVVEVSLNQGRDRITEDKLVCDLILDVLANSLGVKPLNEIKLDADNGETFSIRLENDKSIGYILNEESDLTSTQNLAQLKQIAVYAGSFSSLHDGHTSIYNHAKEILGQEVYFELSTHNKDKGFIDYIEVEDRLKQLDKHEFILTNRPKFTEKFSTIFKYAPMSQITFVMGKDTFDRVEESDYDFFIKNNVKFLVFPRNGEKIVPNDKLAKLLIHLDKTNQIVLPNISSSEIRKNLTKTK